MRVPPDRECDGLVAVALGLFLILWALGDDEEGEDQP